MPGNDVVGKMKKQKEEIEDELTFEEQEVLDDEVFKRDIINNHIPQHFSFLCTITIT
jgi:hypothetical protein